MQLKLPVLLISSLLLLVSCNTNINLTLAPAPTGISATAPSGNAANADVLFVQAIQIEDKSWTFNVTVSHPDTGWEDYADGWDVVLPDGTVPKNNPTDAFTRLLLHPHIDEQPFTRSQSGLQIPAGTTNVNVRAHDLIAGFGGQEISVDLTKADGPGFEVQRAAQEQLVVIGSLYVSPDGNQYLNGYADLQNQTPIDIALNGIPIWITTLNHNNVSYWVVMLEDGRIQAFHAKNGIVTPLDLNPSTLSPQLPPAIMLNQDRLTLLPNPFQDQAALAPPILLPDWQTQAYVLPNGDLVVDSPQSDDTLKINALPDSQLLSNPQGQILLLANPTDAYDHAILGDGLEAQSLILIDTNPTPQIVQQIEMPEGLVVEGLAPIWVDIDQDGQREIIVTVSAYGQGAQILIFNQAGDIIARGQPIGESYRWRHQIAVAPFGPNGEIELVDVLTPHIGGVVEFFALSGSQLELVAQIPGFTSHVIGSRNLTMALAADFDSDQHIELLLPTQDRTTLGAIQRTESGALVDWLLPQNSIITTNLAATQYPDGQIALGIGLAEGILRLWLP